MPIINKWYDDTQNILITTYTGEWSLEDLHESIRDIRVLIKGITHPFVTILDYTDSDTPPRNVLSASSNMNKDRNPHYIGMIMLRPGLLLRSLAKIMTTLPQMRNDKMVVVDTMEEALKQADLLLNIGEKEKS